MLLGLKTAPKRGPKTGFLKKKNCRRIKKEETKKTLKKIWIKIWNLLKIYDMKNGKSKNWNGRIFLNFFGTLRRVSRTRMARLKIIRRSDFEIFDFAYHKIPYYHNYWDFPDFQCEISKNSPSRFRQKLKTLLRWVSRKLRKRV